MKNITKVGLSALAGALAMTSVNAGEMSISGSMEASYTKGSGYLTTGNPFGMDKELSITGSGELDNGTTVSYKQTVGDTFGFNDSELVFGNVMGTTATVAMTSTGSPISAIDDVTPTAFEEANALIGSVKDVNGMDGTYGIRVTMADVMGSGFKVDAMYTPDAGSGDAQADNGTSGETGGASGKGVEISLTGSVPMVEGLDVGFGYYDQDTDGTNAKGDPFQDEGTAYIKYSTGPISVGFQKGAVSLSSAGGASTEYVNDMIGISYKLTDDLSISYNELESEEANGTSANVVQDFESISISYSIGGMTIGLADADVSNASYTSGRTMDETSVSLSIAF
jgi:outer membrane protein OmpU